MVSLIRLDLSHFAKFASAIKSVNIDWFNVMIFEIQNSLQDNVLGAILNYDFTDQTMGVTLLVSTKLKWKKSLVGLTNRNIKITCRRKMEMVKKISPEKI